MMRGAFSWDLVVVDATDRVVKRLWEGDEWRAKKLFDRVVAEGLKEWPDGVEPLRLRLSDSGRRVRRVEQLQRERTSELQHERTSAELAGVRTQLEAAS